MTAPQSVIGSATVIQDETEVRNRLSSLGLVKSELLEVAFAAATARNDSVRHDPANAAGTLAYIYGTRALRDIHCRREPWVADGTNGVESIFNPRTGMKVIYQNADVAGLAAKEPQPISNKGEATKALVNLANGDLFRGWSTPGKAPSGAVWYLCVCIEEESIGVELVCPRAVEGGRFEGCIERIMLEAPGEGEAEGLALGPDQPDDDVDGFEVNVSRKR